MSGVVSEFNGRNGPVALQQSDVVNVLPNATVPGAITVNGALSAASADLSGNVTVGGALSGTAADLSGNVSVGGALSAASADVSGAMTVGGALSGTTADLSGSVTVGGGQDSFILTSTGVIPSPGRPFGALAAYYDGVGVQANTNFGADANPMFGVATNDRTLVLEALNGGRISTLKNTLDDGSGNATVGGGLSAASADVSGNVTVGGALSGTTADLSGNATIGGALSVTDGVNLYPGGLPTAGGSGLVIGPTVSGQAAAIYVNVPTGFPDWIMSLEVNGGVVSHIDASGNFYAATADLSGNVTVGGALSAVTADLSGAMTVGGALSGATVDLSGDVTVGGSQDPVILTGTGIALSPGRAWGALAAYFNGIGIQTTTNFGADTNQMFGVATNDRTLVLEAFNGGRIVTLKNTLDDGSGNAAFSGTVTASSLSASLSASTALTAGGTTAQTIANLFAERGVTPFDFGAAGNGTTDDTAAIQAALNTGKPVILPNGYTFALASSLNLPIGAVLVGQGGKLAPSTENAALQLTQSAATDYRGALITGIRIEPTVAGGHGINAQFANNFTVENCEFTGCSGNSVALTSCQYWSIRNCLVRSSGAPAYQPGGSIISTASWTSSGGGTLGGPGTIEGVQFGPGPQASGVTSPCIHIVNSPAVDVINCVGPDLAWGGSTSSPPPITFILIEGQCQGNIIRGCYATLMSYGVLIQPQGGTQSPATGTVMPSYILVDGCNFDSFGSAGVGVFGSVAFPNGSFIWVRGGGITEPQSIVTGATVSAGGSGYEVGDILSLPAPSAQVEGASAMLEVTAVSSGAVTGVSVFNGGLTQTTFSGAQSVTGGHGTGATFTLTQSNAAVGVYMQYVSDARVDSVQLQNYGGGTYGDGVVFENCTRPAIANNTFEAFSVAVAYDNCTNFMDFGNVFNGNSTNFYTYGLSGQEGSVGTAGSLYANGVAAQAIFTNSLATNPAGGTLEVNNAIDFNSNVTGQFAIDNPTTLASATWYQNTLGGPAWLSVPVLLPAGAAANLYVAQASGDSGTTTTSPVAWISNPTGAAQSIVLSLNGVIPTGAWYYISLTGGASLNPSGYPNGFYRFL